MITKRHLCYTSALVAISLYTSACQSTAPGGIEVRTVEVPVPQPCLPLSEIPAEPETVSHLLNGMAAHDLSIVAASALELRAWGQEMAAALRACAG